jgi:radical SAM-linked protein
LPLGFASRAEVMDMWLNEDVDDVVPALQANVPPGLTILRVEEVDEREPSLQTQVVAAEYEVEITEAGYGLGLTEKIASVMESESIPRERRNKQYDLRPLIEELTPLSLSGREAGGEGQGLFMSLTACEGATGRPEEVLDELGIPIEDCRIERTALIFDKK